MLRERLRAIHELVLASLDHTRLRAQSRELLLETVLALNAAHEHAVFLARVMRFLGHPYFAPPCACPNTSAYSFSHFWPSSRMALLSMNFSGNLLSLVSILRLVG